MCYTKKDYMVGTGHRPIMGGPNKIIDIISIGWNCYTHCGRVSWEGLSIRPWIDTILRAETRGVRLRESVADMIETYESPSHDVRHRMATRY